MVVLYFVCHAPRIITNTVEMAVATDKIPIVSYRNLFQKYNFQSLLANEPINEIDELVFSNLSYFFNCKI